jgi:hypothetical protein
MNHRQVLEPTPAQLTITPWSDAVVEAVGHRPGSPYLEACWLPILGPSGTWCWQRLSRLAAVRPGARIDAVDLAVSLGLGEGLGRNAPISRTLGRLVAFETAYRSGDAIAVRLALPDLSARHAARLPVSARMAHKRLARQPLPPSRSRVLTTAPEPSPSAAPEGLSL